jgi:hypothetical protein
VRTLVILCSLLAIASGCKSKPKRRAPPANAGSGVTAGLGSDVRPAPDLVLPRGDGTPPKKTTTPLGKADFEKLAKLEYPGFIAEVRTVGDKVFEVRQKTKDHPRMWAVVTIQPCFDCVPMDLAKWKAKEDDLKSLNLEALKSSPGIDWELGQADLHGAPVIYAYQVGAGKGSADVGGETYSFTNLISAYYNDGVNQIRVVGAYKDDPMSKEDLIKVAPKADLEALALSFLDAYTHAWQ